MNCRHLSCYAAGGFGRTGQAIRGAARGRCCSLIGPPIPGHRPRHAGPGHRAPAQPEHLVDYGPRNGRSLPRPCCAGLMYANEQKRFFRSDMSGEAVCLHGRGRIWTGLWPVLIRLPTTAAPTVLGLEVNVSHLMGAWAGPASGNEIYVAGQVFFFFWPETGCRG